MTIHCRMCSSHAPIKELIPCSRLIKCPSNKIHESNFFQFLAAAAAAGAGAGGGGAAAAAAVALFAAAGFVIFFLLSFGR